jgi:Seven in absentia protein family
MHIKHHELQCKYRDYQCPYTAVNDCVWRGKLHQVQDHCNFDHGHLYFEAEPIATIQLLYEKKSCNIPFIFTDHIFVVKAYGHLFRCCWRNDFSKSLLIWNVIIIGDTSDLSKDYEYVLGFINGDNRTEFSGRCLSEVPQEDSFRELNTFPMSRAYMDSNCIDGNLTFTVLIKKIEKMSEDEKVHVCKEE